MVEQLVRFFRYFFIRAGQQSWLFWLGKVSTRTYFMAALVMVLALLVRFYQLGNIFPSTELRELSSGYRLLAQVSGLIVGGGDWANRIPSVIAGLLAIILTMSWLRRWFGWREGMLLAGLILAVSPVMIWQSRIVGEAMVGLLVTLAIIHLIFPSPLLSPKLLGLRQSLPKVSGSSWLSYLRRMILSVWRSLWLRVIALIFLIVGSSVTDSISFLLVPGLLIAMPWWWGRLRTREWGTMMVVGLVAWMGSYLLLAPPALMQLQMWEQLQLLTVGPGQFQLLVGLNYLPWSIYWLGWIGLLFLSREVWQLVVLRRDEDHHRHQDLIHPLKSKSVLLYLIILARLPVVITGGVVSAAAILLFLVIWMVLAVKGMLKICVFASLTGKWLATVLKVFPSWWVLQLWRGLIMIILGLLVAYPSGVYLQDLLKLSLLLGWF